MRKGGDNKSYTRVCVECGKVLLNVGSTKKRCPECAKAHDKIKRCENDVLKHEEAVRNYFIKKHDDSALLADSHEADMAGLSYGIWRQRKKPAGVGAPTSCKG